MRKLAHQTSLPAKCASGSWLPPGLPNRRTPCMPARGGPRHRKVTRDWPPGSGSTIGVPSSCTRRQKASAATRSEEHTSELQSQSNLVCRLLLEKKKDTRSDFQSRLTKSTPPAVQT